MAILRSFTVANSTRTLSNAAVDQALSEWESRVNQARDEGIALGLRQAAEQVQEAKAIQAGVDEKIKTIQQAADLKIKQQQQQWQHNWGQILSSLQVAIDQVAGLEKQAIASAERGVLELALEMAGHVLQHEVEQNDAWMLPILQAAIKQLPDKRQIQMRMHSQDAQRVQEQRRALSESLQQPIAFEVIADDQITLGAISLESQGTHIDSGVPHTWERLCAHMLAVAPLADWQSAEIAGNAEVKPMPVVDTADARLPDTNANTNTGTNTNTDREPDEAMAAPLPSDSDVAQTDEGHGDQDVES